MTGERLTSQEVADLLGVRLETVYAYASRGLLTSRRAASGRGSTFDREQAEALRDRGRGDRAAVGSWRGPTVDTDVTLIADGHLYLRGVDAVTLSRSRTFEDVAEWLWTGDESGARFVAPEPQVSVARGAVSALPPGTDPVSALRVAVAAASSADPLRFDVSGAAVLDTARGLVATMVDALPVLGRDVDGPSARRLWARLGDGRAPRALVSALDAALVLLVDHDLAASTVAARVAASTRAHPYAVVLAGLAAMDGPLHGGASSLAVDLLRATLAGDARSVVAEHLRTGRALPGFGHRLYPDGDPRAAALLDRLRDEPVARQTVRAADELAGAARQHPNVDLALAVLAVSGGLVREAGEVVFAVARSVGWVAHALEEYDEPPLRFRGHGRYRGPRP